MRNSSNYYLFLFCRIYILTIVLAFLVIPVIFLRSIYEDESLILGKIVLLSSSIVFISVFFNTSIKFNKVKVRFIKFTSIVFFLFFVFTTITFFTAPKIPVIESIKGASKDELAVYREMFLKARTGWEASLGYIIGILTGAIIPFLIALAFEKKSKFRYILLCIFFLFSISFLEKAFFLKALIPVFFVLLTKSKNKKLFFISSISVLFVFFIFMAILSGVDNTSSDFDSSNFFTVQYNSQGPVDMIIWRGLVIPIVTALDGIRVFYDQFSGRFFHGATSSFLASIFGLERLNFERELFFNQWGQNETETGNANAVFLLEAFVNFGYVGVLFFSIIVSKIFSIFSNHASTAAKGMFFLFLFNIFNAGLIGALLSNGFLFLLLILIFVKLE